MQSLLLPAKETAHLLSVTTKTVTFWSENPAYAHLGFPKPIRVMTNKFYDRAEIEAWLERRKAERGHTAARPKDSKARGQCLAANRASVESKRRKKVSPASRRWAHA